MIGTTLDFSFAEYMLVPARAIRQGNIMLTLSEPIHPRPRRLSAVLIRPNRG